MQTVVPLEPGQYFHIYDRGINRSSIFFEERNYAYFLRLYAKHIVPVAETYAYCLMGNHFHLLVRIRTERVDRHGLEDRDGLDQLDRTTVSQAFGNWLNAYAKAINKAYGRTGNLFQHPFGRRAVDSDTYFAALVQYIHHNPRKHGFVEDFRQWPHSSYHSLLTHEPTKLERDVVLEWFGGRQEMRLSHSSPADESAIGEFIGEDA